MLELQSLGQQSFYALYSLTVIKKREIKLIDILVIVLNNMHKIIYNKLYIS